MQKHVVLTFIGSALAILAVAWVQPTTAGGVGFLVAIILLAANAVGVTVSLLRKSTPASSKLRAEQQRTNPS